MSASKGKVRKIIKKTGKFLAWTSGILVVLLVAAYFAFRSPAVQTWVAQKLGNYLADELNTKITIQGVDIKFFTSIELENLYVEDQHGDTLLDAPSFVVNLSEFDYNAQHVRLDAITLTNANIKLKKYEGEKGLNFRFFVQYFKSTDTIVDTTGTPWDVELGTIKLENCRFAFIDTRFNDVDRGMDYENIRVHDISATFERIEPMDDSTALFLSELKAKEQCGFTLEHMESRMMLSDTFVKFNDLVIKTPGSDIKGWIGFHYDSIEDVEDDFVHKVKMDGHFSESVVEMGDVAYFSPVLLGIQKKVLLTGDVNGTAEKLKTRNMDLRFGKSSRIAGNFSFDGLPDIESTDMHFKFKESTTNYEDLSDIPVAPFNDTSFLEVSSRIAVLGDMSFTGTMEGFIHDFVAHGKLRTAQGSLVLENLVMTKDSAVDDYNWDGILTAQEFNIGAFLGVPEMGHISGTANMIGYGTDVPSIVASMNANFSAFEYNGYRYSNITVTEGTLAKEVFNGIIDMHDPNVDLHYEGFVDFKDPKKPILDFYAKIDSANVGMLGFADTSYGLIISTEMDFKMQGSNIDNLEGYMTLNNLNFVKDGKAYSQSSMSLFSQFNADGSRELNFNSDFAIATMTGKFEVMEIEHAVKDVMSAYLPAYFPPHPVDPKSKNKETSQQFSFMISFLRNTDAIKAFVPELMIAPSTLITGDLNQAQRALNVEIQQCDSFAYGAYELYGIGPAKVKGTNGAAKLDIEMDRVQLNDSTGFDNVVIHSTAGSNKLVTELYWQNETEKDNSAKLVTTTTFESQSSLNVKIEEGRFAFNDTTWQADPTGIIRRDSSVWTFRNVSFRSGAQFVIIGGRVSENPKDVLTVHLNDFNLQSLNFFLGGSGVTFAGAVSGDVNLSNLYHAPKFDGDAELKKIRLNNEKLGDGTAKAIYHPDVQGIEIDVVLSNGAQDLETGGVINNILLAGYYYPQRKEESLDLTLKLRQMPLGLIKPVLADYCSMVVGHIGGLVKINGSFEKPLLNGDLDLSIGKVKVDYLGIELVHKPAQKFYVRQNSFEFDNFKVSDNQRDTAVINGQLFHDNFSNFQFDMYFEFNHFLVLNTTDKDNEDYYGRVYATGYMDLFGYADKKITMNISARTSGVIRGGNLITSDFNIPMSSSSEAGENDFIEFKSENEIVDSGGAVTKKAVFNDNGIELNLNLEVNDSALVHVIFDETVGDELSARGSGLLDMHIKPNGDFTMFGSYEVERGDYMFTLKNVVYAPFELVQGGIISWNGDPADAHIDADAIYIANASVEPFFPFDSTTAAYKQNYPVHVIMHLDGKLVNPGLSFDIELPTADPNIQETVRSYTQSELEMNRQVLSLMVLNSFMTPSEFRDGTDGAGAGAAGTTLLSNFVSGTLNNWLSQISENANVKFKYRPNDDMSLQELKLALGTQLLNNRLTFDVAGSLTNATQTQVQGGYNQYVDVNVEYKVTEDGKVRLRAFNRGNEQSTFTQGANHTQGAGVFYREDFETFRELMDRYRVNWKKPANEDQKKKAEEEKQQQNPNPEPPKQDTAPGGGVQIQGDTLSN